MGRIFDAGYRAARRLGKKSRDVSEILEARKRSRVRTRNPLKWGEGFKAGQMSIRKGK